MNAPHLPHLRRRTWVEIALIAAIAVVTLVGVTLIGARFGVLLPQGRFLIGAAASGLKVGRLGRLRVEGITGDIWRDVRVRRLTISDEAGVWLEADNAHMQWRYLDLLSRHFHADLIEADAVKLLRRPTLTPKGEDSDLPLSFHIARAHTVVQVARDVSYEPGDYALDLSLDVERSGGQRGQVRALSLTRPGDHLNLDYDVAKSRPLKVLADVGEARGGALAALAGLPPKQPFSLKVTAGGQLSAGQFVAVATSGASQPLRAQGAWTKDGGDARGRVSLTASSLTAPYAQRLGPEASFVLVGRRAGPDLFALEARLASENLALRIHGLGDLGQRHIGPQGLEVAAQAAQLSRILPGPRMGPARITGHLTEAKPGWRFQGAASAGGLAYAGYGLAQASGPLEVLERAGQWDVKTSLTG
ncbi:MAG TPA: translocation/assembly module TamB, partial [Phenylobacterium sp.]